MTTETTGQQAALSPRYIHRARERWPVLFHEVSFPVAKIKHTCGLLSTNDKRKSRRSLFSE